MESESVHSLDLAISLPVDSRGLDHVYDLLKSTRVLKEKTYQRLYGRRGSGPPQSPEPKGPMSALIIVFLKGTQTLRGALLRIAPLEGLREHRVHRAHSELCERFIQ
jgi:hypothetical protein